MSRHDDLQALRDRLAGPDGLADIERALAAPPPPRPIEKDFPNPAGTIRGVLRRRWAPGVRPGTRVPLIYRAELEVGIGDADGGSESMTPVDARAVAAALLDAAQWVEAWL